MKRILFSLLIGLTVLSASAAPPPAMKRASEACWLWVREGNQEDLDFTFRQEVSLNCLLRTKLQIDEPVKRAWFYSWADKKGEYFLNGEILKLRPWEPFAKLRGHVKARGVDITHLLKPGENVLAIAAATTPARSCFGVMLRGGIEFVSGRRIDFVSSAKNFKASDREEGGWELPGFDDSRWLPAREIGDVRLSPWILCGDMFTQFATKKEIAKWEAFCREGFPAEKLEREPDVPQLKVVYSGITPGIEINGKTYPANQWSSIVYSSCPTTDKMIEHAGQTGLNVYMMMLGSDNLYADDRYQLEDLDRAMNRFLAIDPSAYFVFWFKGNLPKEWIRANPDELVGFAKKSDRKGWHEYGGNPDVPSLASQKYLDELSRRMKMIADFSLAKPWGKRVIGVVMGYGGSGDGTPYGGLSMPDTGKRMTEAFRLYLRKKYGSDAALQRAWAMPEVTLDSAAVPDERARWGSGSYLRDPADPRDVRLTDYYTCYHDKFADWMISWGKAAKEAFPGRLAGAYYGYMILAYTAEASTANFEKVLQSPYIDFLRATTLGYNLTDGLHRQLHSVFHRYGKFASIEGDLRTHAQKASVIARGEQRWLCKTPEETRASVAKFVGNSLLFGCAYHTVDFGSNRGNWYFDCPEALETIARGTELWKEYWRKPLKPAADIAVIIDYRQILKQGHPVYMHNRFFEYGLLGNLMQSLNFSGCTNDWMALEDYLASRHPYKVVIFANTFEITPEQRKALLAKIRRPGVTAIWNYAPGIVTPDGFSAAAMTALTGIKLDFTRDPRIFSAKLTSAPLNSNAAPFTLPNGSFEAPLLRNWRLAKLNCDAEITLDGSTVAEGQQALKLTVSRYQAPYCSVLQNQAVSSDAVLRGKQISICYRGRNPATLLVRYRIVVNGRPDYRYEIIPLPESENFRRTVWPLTPPAGTNELCVELRAVAPGDYYFDDCRIEPAALLKFFRNGGFEAGGDGWRWIKHSRDQQDAVTFSRDNTVAAEGKSSLRIDVREDLNAIACAYQKVMIPDTRPLRGKSLAVSFKGSRPVDIVFDFTRKIRGKTEHVYTFAQSEASEQWTKISVPLNVPEDAVSMAIELRVRYKGTYWFDDFEICDGYMSIAGHETLPEAPRVYSVDPKAKVLAAYTDDGTAALVRKKLPDGSTAIFAGIPINHVGLWRRILNGTGCHAYTPAGFYVRSNNRLLMVFALADGTIAPECNLMKWQISRAETVPLKFPKHQRRITDLFTGEALGKDTDSILLRTKRPRVWLFEVEQ